MSWDRSAPTNPKYRSREHRELRAKYARQIKAGQYVECTAVVCLFASRQIVTANGRVPDGLHLGHNDDGVTYAGPQHAACNVRDGAKRGRGRQDGPPRRWLL